MRKPAVKNLLVLTIGLFFAVLLLEGGLRLFEPIGQRVRGDKIVLPANRQYVFDDVVLRGVSERVVHTKNDLGFRGPNPPEAGLASHLSIAAVGGSTTECFYLPDGADWSAQLADRLHPSVDSLWINNAGLDGHSTYGHTILVRDHLSKLKLDLILFLVGGNEIGRRGGSPMEAEQVRGEMQFSSPKSFVKSAAAYSRVVSLGLNLYRAARAWVQGLPHQNIDPNDVPQVSRSDASASDERADRLVRRHRAKYLPAYRKRLRRLIRVTWKSGAEPVLITQPKLYGPERDPRTGVDLATLKVNEHSGRTMWRLVEQYNDVTRAVGTEKDILVIDLARLLPKNSTFFYDYTHFTEAGAAMVATLIEKELTPYLREHYPAYVKPDSSVPYSSTSP